MSAKLEAWWHYALLLLIWICRVHGAATRKHLRIRQYKHMVYITETVPVADPAVEPSSPFLVP